MRRWSRSFRRCRSVQLCALPSKIRAVVPAAFMLSLSSHGSLAEQTVRNLARSGAAPGLASNSRASALGWRRRRFSPLRRRLPCRWVLARTLARLRSCTFAPRTSSPSAGVRGSSPSAPPCDVSRHRWHLCRDIVHTLGGLGLVVPGGSRTSSRMSSPSAAHLRLVVAGGRQRHVPRQSLARLFIHRFAVLKANVAANPRYSAAIERTRVPKAGNPADERHPFDGVAL